jgi:peptidoglycan hydrolase CwlO-like protein
MKKIKNINLLLIVLLLLILIYNCFSKKTIENVENSCPTQKQVKDLQDKNDDLSKKVAAHQQKINEQNNTIQQTKTKNFCDSAKEKFEDLNNQVNSIIKNLKNNNE